MSFLTNFFIPNKDEDSSLSKAEKLQLNAQIRLVSFTHAFTGLAFFLIFFIQLKYIEDYNFTIFAVPITATILFLGLFYMKYMGNPKLSYWLTVILIFTVTPLRGYFAGGAGAGVISWYITTLVIISAIHSKRTVYISALIGVAQILFLFLTPLPSYNINQTTEMYACALAYITCAGTLRVIKRVNEELTEEAKRLERTETLNILITTLSHEINNPLTIAVGNVQILEKELETNKRFSQVNSSLNRITDIVKTISTIKDFSEEDLEEYTKKSKMLDIKKNLKLMKDIS